MKLLTDLMTKVYLSQNVFYTMYILKVVIFRSSILSFYVFLGRQFDKHGNLKQWWNNRTIAEFRGAAQCIIEQYNNYTLEPYGLQIDGRLTQGENIADNGGLKQAYRVIIR